MVCVSKLVSVSHLAAGDEPGGQRGSLCAALSRAVSGLFRHQPVGIGQFVIQYRDVRAHHPGEAYHYLTSTRIHGFMGHWMHFGGQQMLVFVFPGGVPAAGERRKSKGANSKLGAWTHDFRISIFEVSVFWWVLLALVVLSISLNFTRGVWLGCFLAGIYLVARWKPKCSWPCRSCWPWDIWGRRPLVRERLPPGHASQHEPALSIRLEMWRVAIQMIRAHPGRGSAPTTSRKSTTFTCRREYARGGVSQPFSQRFPSIRRGERGLPCLASWVWLMGALGWYTWKARRQLSAQRWIADASLAAWMAFLAEGVLNSTSAPRRSSWHFYLLPARLLLRWSAKSARPEFRIKFPRAAFRRVTSLQSPPFIGRGRSMRAGCSLRPQDTCI